MVSVYNLGVVIVVAMRLADLVSLCNSLETYGAKVTQLGAEAGSRPSQEAIKEACSKTQFKFVTVTHVDTS